jgi:hypothetical protein
LAGCAGDCSAASASEEVKTVPAVAAVKARREMGSVMILSWLKKEHQNDSKPEQDGAIHLRLAKP